MKNETQKWLIILIVFFFCLTVMLLIENVKLRDRLELISAALDYYSKFIDDLYK